MYAVYVCHRDSMMEVSTCKVMQGLMQDRRKLKPPLNLGNKNNVLDTFRVQSPEEGSFMVGPSNSKCIPTALVLHT